MRIAVLDDYQSVFSSLDAARRLQGHEVVTFSDSVRGLALASRLAGFDAVLLTQQRTAFPREVVEALPPSLRFIAQTGRNTSHLDLEACAQRNLEVVCAGVGTPAAPAELTWALILASRRHLVAEVNALAAGRWQTTVGTTLAGSTLGIWALGRIGTVVAHAGRAFGMRVLCFGREASATRAKAAGFEVASSREQLFAEADVLSLHLPLSAETRGIVTIDDLRRMKASALFVNTSRAGLIAPGALEEALDSGSPGAAALDVFDEEPLPAGNTLVARPNVLATPHLGYVTHETLERYYAGAIEALLAKLRHPLTLTLSPAGQRE